MPVMCPLCATQNAADAAECATCGHQLFTDAELLEEVAPLDGLEQTIHDPLESGPGAVPAMLELERTQVARRDLPVSAEPLPGVEHTQVEEDPAAVSRWTGGVDLDLGRAPDDGVRTLPPQEGGVCSWCGQPAEQAVCEHCGMRRSLYTAPPAGPEMRRVDGDNVLCPACFARVPPGPRCIECGVPFPVVEL